MEGAPMQRLYAAGSWGFLAVVGVLLMWAGFTGRVGPVLGALLTPRDMIVTPPGS
jgi:hypothetical protein